MSLPVVPPHDFLPVGWKEIPKLSERGLSALDDLLFDESGRMRVLEAGMLRALPHHALQYWASERGRYQFPTLELVQWLRERVAGRPSIEIGAGYGDIGRNVGLTLTDSHFQTSEEMRRLYGVMHTKPITPPSDVMKREGLAAAMRYRPAVCLACWVTQRYQPGDEETQTGSCVGGVDFEALLPYVGELVFVGNAETHRSMRLRSLPHEEFDFPWIVSRAHDQSLNRIWVWKGGKEGV